MNRMMDKRILLFVVSLLCGLGSRLYGQVELQQVDDINLTGFPTDEILLRGERHDKVSENKNDNQTLFKSFKESLVKKKMAMNEPMGNLHQMQKMNQYPAMDIAGQMKKMRALQWTGRGLWIAGSVLTITGIIMASSASGYASGYDPNGYWDYSDYYYYDDSYLAPLIIGVVFVGTGIPLDVVYTRRIKELKRSINYSASLDFGVQKYGIGFGLHF